MRIEDKVTAQQKEWCVLGTLCQAMEISAQEKQAKFADVFFEFVDTWVYEALFDFDTGLWREGPIYLLNMSEEAQHAKARHCRN